MKKGFTLVEVLVGIFLILIVFLGIFGAYQLGLKVVGQAKARTIAIYIGNEQLENIRNLSYGNIGISGGYPSGVLPNSTTTFRNNIEFKIEYQIQYEIDPKDGIDCDPTNVIPDDQTYRLSLDGYDCCPNDYKKIKLKVSWKGILAGEVTMDTIVSPKNSEEECGEKGGLIKVEVNNQKGNNVEFPYIKVTRLSTGFSWIKQPATGVTYFLLATTTTADYKIEVSKTEYSSSQTHGIGEVYQGQTIATPAHSHVALSEGELEEHTFFIDKLAKFFIQTLEAKAKHIYYVRTTGSDSNNGLSPDTAFLTIQKAASSTAAGDIVFVGAGTYDEKITIYNSGTAAEPIAFVADTVGTYTGDSGEVKISGKDIGFYIDSKKYLKIYGFEIENTTGTAGIYITGSNAGDIELINNYISNNTGDGIRVDSASDILISHNTISLNATWGIYLNGANSIQVVKNRIFQNLGHGISNQGGNNVEIKWNEVFSNGQNGIFVFQNANNNQVKNNVVYSNFGDGIQIYDHASSIEVLNNKSYSNQGNGISFKNNISNANKITSNLVYLNQKSGILLSDNCVNNTISNNTSFQNSENGILIELSSNNNEIEDNIVASSTLAGVKVATSTNIDVTYNDVWANSLNYDGISSGTGSISVDPLFVALENGDFHLSQISAGQATTSPCVDAGSDTALNLGLNNKTTRTDNVTDSGQVDMGFHYSLESPPSLPSPPDPFGAAIPNTTFHLKGEKTVGQDAGENLIYKYSTSTATNASGQLTLSDLEWDYYHFSNFIAAGISLDLIASYPSPAIGGETSVYLAPDTTTTVKLGLRAENTLLVKVQDASSTEPIFASEVRLYATGYDTTKVTDIKGEVYFIPLEKKSYNLEVTAIGYATSTVASVPVGGHVEKIIALEKE